VAGGKPTDIDRRIGQRLRQRRKDYDVSLETVGAAIGLSWQQIQKYENAQNKVPAATLFELARQWDVPLGWFFEA